MKTLKSISTLFFLLALLASTFIVGCQKEEMKETPAALDPNGAYFMAPDGSIEQIDLDALENNPEVTFRNGNGNPHVNAHYSWQPGNSYYVKTTTWQFNATENNQGTNGVGHMWRTWGDEGEFAYHVILDADCLFTNEEGEAIFVGVVTEVTGEFPPSAPNPGARMWVRVKDNGQGPNAPLDQHKGLIWNPSGSIPCDNPFFGLNGSIWNFNPPYENVANASDNINVN